jgi:hypothetical protein
MPRGGHAKWPVQGSRWKEHGAAYAGGPRAQQASKLETRALFAGSQGGTVARAGGNACGPLSARLDLKPRGPAVEYGPHRTIYLTDIDANGEVARASARRRFRALELTGPLRPYGSAHFGPGLAMDTNCSD